MERLHKAMEKELHQNKSEMSERAKNRHGKLLARLEAKKKRLAKKAAMAKKRADEEKKTESIKTEALASTNADTASTSKEAIIPPSTPVARRGGVNAATTDTAMSMVIPTADSSVESQEQFSRQAWRHGSCQRGEIV